MLQALIASIAGECGINLSRYEPVDGGDINESYCLHGLGKKYFLKLNDADRFPRMFAMEADGLEALRTHSRLVVPALIKYGSSDNRQWLLLQWIEKDAPAKNSFQLFGAALAGMHRQTNMHFGWHCNNYIGSLQQLNTAHHNWADFFAACRVMPLVKMLINNGSFLETDMTAASALCNKLANVFPEEPPALLHGDCWSGNYMITTGGRPAVFDPAVYYGHREMDIGLSKLFGGFPAAFYEAYQEVYPLEKGWQQRLALSQLYPVLVHAVLFGGHYIGKARETIRQFQ